MNKIEVPDATPEQLLHLLDQQLRQARAQRRIAPRSRSGIVVGGILLILAVTTAALLFLQQLLLDAGSPESIGEKPPTVKLAK